MINSHAHLDFDKVNDRHIAQNAVAIVPSVSKQNWTVRIIMARFLMRI
jgi:hypothetical protein